MHLSTVVVCNVLLLLIIYQHVQMTPVLRNTSPSMELTERTTESKSPFHLAPCITDSDCHMHGWCKEENCECEKGWITWGESRQCSYKQSSKMIAFVLSLIMGSAGIDWFVLSRRDSLYILCGILKFLISTGCCIWNPLAITSKNKKAMTIATCISVSLSLTSLIWWTVDWIRILLNNFPDGNGAPLV